MDNTPAPSSSSPVVFLPIRGRLSSDARRVPLGPISWPQMIDLLPDGQLQAQVHHHEMRSMISGKLYCWTYISKGLDKFGQKEVIFTVRRRAATESANNFPLGPLEWFQILHSLARDGRIVDQFHQTNFAESPPILDRMDVRLIIYYPRLELSGVPLAILPHDRLHAIPLTAAEAKVARSYGVMRVISHLGSSERLFPVASWIDRDRADCITMEQMKGSVRDELPMQSILGITCIRKGVDIILHIPHSAEDRLRAAVEELPTSDVLSLDCFPYEKADSGMLWHQGITSSRAYGVGASCTSFGFIILCPEQDCDELEPIEDGIYLLLTDSTWISIRTALIQHTPVQVEFNNLRFSLEYESRTSQSRETTEDTTERAPPLLAFGGRPPEWALTVTDDAPVLNPPTYRIPFRAFSPEDCAFSFQDNARVEPALEGKVDRRKPVRASLQELRMDKEKGCDKCDILYRSLKVHLPFVDEEHGVLLHFAARKDRLVCAVKSQSGMAPILEFSARAGEKCHWLAPSNDLAASAGISINRLTQVRGWMASCQTSHSACTSHPQLDPPKRFLDLGTVDQNQARARLCESKTLGAPYSTLSHCWIFDKMITTKARLHEYTTLGIELSQLPQSVQSAVRLLRYLGIQYLWVDSLCIVQDDDEDWTSQTTRIADIYEGSELTVAVPGSGTCAEGCFMSEAPKIPVKKFRWPGTGGLGGYMVEAGYSSIHTPFYEGMKREKHLTMLHRTPSVHQERQYSPRILYVGADELVYKCREQCQCECGYQIRY